MRPDMVVNTGRPTGIGCATAATFAKAGYHVDATTQKPEDLADSRATGATIALPHDVTDEGSIEAAASGRLDRQGQTASHVLE